MTVALKRRKPNQKRAQKTLAKLLSSAKVILINEGVTSLTSRRLAKQAEISVGVIYDYFPSMQALVFWIYEERLNKRLQIYNDCMMGDNLNRPLKEAFPAYLRRMRDEQMWSSLDIELHNAAAKDAKLKELIAEFEDQLTERVCECFEARGSTRSRADLRRFALYSNAVDHASWTLRLNANKDSKALYGELTTRVDLMLMQQAGVLNGQEVDELAALLVGAG